MSPEERKAFPPISEEEKALILERRWIVAIQKYRARHVRPPTLEEEINGFQGGISTIGLRDAKEVFDYERNELLRSGKVDLSYSPITVRTQNALRSLMFDFASEGYTREEILDQFAYEIGRLRKE